MKLKRIILAVVLSGLFLSGCGSVPTSLLGPTESLPGEAIQKGTLANKKLVNDTLYGVAAKVATLGCEKMDSVQPYVLEMPAGHVGSRFWTELWVVNGCESEYEVEIMFDEVGLSAADYTIL